jgi:serine/threonine protein kinase
VKVLDFGLAKLVVGDGSAPGLTRAPVVTQGGRQQGAVIGTAAYMSPEQARGLAVDKRTDIWAFGCVLYEMLTGARAFGGDETTDTLAFIITRPVEWTALPPATPPEIRTLLRRCLEKDRRERLADLSVARLDIKDALAALRLEPMVVTGRGIRQRPASVVAAFFTLTTLALATLGYFWRVEGIDRRVYRSTILLPPNVTGADSFCRRSDFSHHCERWDVPPSYIPRLHGR